MSLYLTKFNLLFHNQLYYIYVADVVSQQGPVLKYKKTECQRIKRKNTIILKNMTFINSAELKGEEERRTLGSHLLFSFLVMLKWPTDLGPSLTFFFLLLLFTAVKNFCKLLRKFEKNLRKKLRKNFNHFWKLWSGFWENFLINYSKI